MKQDVNGSNKSDGLSNLMKADKRKIHSENYFLLFCFQQLQVTYDYTSVIKYFLYVPVYVNNILYNNQTSCID